MTDYSLFKDQNLPLAEKLRPKKIDDFIGLDQIDPWLEKLLNDPKNLPPSLIFWGPPGSGKTTLARLVANVFNKKLIEYSAVLGSMKEVKEVLLNTFPGQARVLFIDEIHRFNKAQQDAFLPYLENGSLILLGATTENPSFYLNSALLSRLRVVQVQPHTENNLIEIAKNILQELKLEIISEDLLKLIRSVDGDARRLINKLEFLARLNPEARKQAIAQANDLQVYDRNDAHYAFASALIKSMRGSDPDAALFYAFKMITAGDDPRFIFRRLIIFASEDVGNADPRALQIALSAFQAFEVLGFPEGKIPLAQAITYLACAPKSNRSYLAMHAAEAAVRQYPAAMPPKHILNAPTQLMKDLAYGENYQYPHDSEDAYLAGVRYLPDQVSGDFYQLSDRGYEQKLLEYRKKLKAKNPK